MDWVRYGTTDVTVGNCKEPETARKFLSQIGLVGVPLIMCQQVHGCEISLVKEKGTEIIPQTDGLVTQKAGVVLGIVTADCVPIFLFDEIKRGIALLHAGWRGVAGQIVVQGIHGMKQNFSSDPKNIEAHLGPHIRECCFEVGGDVAEKFSQEHVQKKGAKFTVSLEGEIRTQLNGCGVRDWQISLSGECTVHNKEFFSYRRDKTNKRMLSYILINEKND